MKPQKTQVRGKEAYKFASDLFGPSVNNQTRHYRAKLYGRMVIYYSFLGTDSAGNIHTNCTQYAILKSLGLLHHKSYYLKILKQMAAIGLLCLNNPSNVIIRTKSESSLPVEILAIFEKMDTLYGVDDFALYSYFGHDMLMQYFLRHKRYTQEKSWYIMSQILSEANVIIADWANKNNLNTAEVEEIWYDRIEALEAPKYDCAVKILTSSYKPINDIDL